MDERRGDVSCAPFHALCPRPRASSPLSCLSMTRSICARACDSWCSIEKAAALLLLAVLLLSVSGGARDDACGGWPAGPIGWMVCVGACA